MQHHETSAPEEKKVGTLTLRFFNNGPNTTMHVDISIDPARLDDLFLLLESAQQHKDEEWSIWYPCGKVIASGFVHLNDEIKAF